MSLSRLEWEDLDPDPASAPGLEWVEVQDPGLLAKLNQQLSCNSAVGRDCLLQCSDGSLQWSALLLSALSPHLASLLADIETPDVVVLLPQYSLATTQHLLTRLLRPGCRVISSQEAELLQLLGVEPTLWDPLQPAPPPNTVQIVSRNTETAAAIVWKEEARPGPEEKAGVVVERKKAGTGRKMFCKLCSVSFQSRPYSDYQDHINSHKNSEGLFYCNQPGCDKVFRAWCHLSDHVYSHGKLAKPHLCSYCDYSSVTRANIRKHERTRHEDPERRDFSCDKCPKKFKTSSNLYEHLRVHDTDCRHVCSVCQKEFKSVVGFNQHMRIHSGDLFSCNHCGEKFQSKHSVGRHEKDIHGIFRDGEAAKSYKCPNKSCGTEFSKEEDYRLHLKTAHNEASGLLICHLCKKIFSNRVTLKLHFKKQHGSESPGRPSRKKSLLKLGRPPPPLVEDQPSLAVLAMHERHRAERQEEVLVETQQPDPDLVITLQKDDLLLYQMEEEVV